ncbi:MAG: 50S ribosomal protein L32 [Candidatus Taylorbacteria bacterium]|nr:50S ribosomal protein L32 [Candidatus Taylorbacteria bacterium]
MVVRMRHTRSHTGNRRSHHALGKLPLTVCPECGSLCPRHSVCPNCGKYRGRQVIDNTAKISKKENKKKEKEKLGQK